MFTSSLYPLLSLQTNFAIFVQVCSATLGALASIGCIGTWATSLIFGHLFSPARLTAGHCLKTLDEICTGAANADVAHFVLSEATKWLRTAEDAAEGCEDAKNLKEELLALLQDKVTQDFRKESS